MSIRRVRDPAMRRFVLATYLSRYTTTPYAPDGEAASGSYLQCVRTFRLILQRRHSQGRHNCRTATLSALRACHLQPRPQGCRSGGIKGRSIGWMRMGETRIPRAYSVSYAL
jgi:hypothetical protein